MDESRLDNPEAAIFSARSTVPTLLLCLVWIHQAQARSSSGKEKEVDWFRLVLGVASCECCEWWWCSRSCGREVEESLFLVARFVAAPSSVGRGRSRTHPSVLRFAKDRDRVSMALERLWSLVCVVLLVSLAYSANIDMCRVSQAIIDDDARVVACELDDSSSSSFDAATMPLVHVSRRQLDYPAAHPISVNEVVHGDFESTSTVAFILRDVSSTDLLRAALTSVATGPRQPPQTIQLLINDAHTNTLLQVAEAPWPYCNSSTVSHIGERSKCVRERSRPR